MPSRVLPLPPGPVRVSSRERPSNSVASASTSSRPRKLLSGRGRLLVAISEPMLPLFETLLNDFCGHPRATVTTATCTPERRSRYPVRGADASLTTGPVYPSRQGLVDVGVVDPARPHPARPAARVLELCAAGPRRARWAAA